MGVKIKATGELKLNDSPDERFHSMNARDLSLHTCLSGHAIVVFVSH